MSPPNAAQQPERDRRQQHDAPRVGEPVAAERELARHVAVLGQDRGQAREGVEARVRGEEQDQRRARGEGDEQDRARRRRRPAAASATIDGAARARSGAARTATANTVSPMNRMPSRIDHRGHRVGRVLRLGRLERRDAVGDRLDAGQRDRAAGEGLEQEQDADRLEVVRGRERDRVGLGRRPDDGPADDVDQPDRDDRQRQADEQVGRDGEDVARLAQAAQVGDRDQRDRDERDLDPEVVGGRDDRLDLGDRGRRRDRDRHDVVDEQGGRGDQPEDAARGWSWPRCTRRRRSGRRGRPGGTRSTRPPAGS